MIPLTGPISKEVKESPGPNYGQFISVIPSDADSLDIEFALFRKEVITKSKVIDHKYYYHIVGVSNLRSKGQPVIVELIHFQVIVVEPATQNLARLPSPYQNSLNVTVLDQPTELYVFGEKHANIKVALVTWSDIKLRL